MPLDPENILPCPSRPPPGLGVTPTLVSFHSGPCLLPDSVWMDFCFLQNSSTETVKIPWLSLCDTGLHDFFFPLKRAFLQGKGTEGYFSEHLRHAHPVKGGKNISSLRFSPKYCHMLNGETVLVKAVTAACSVPGTTIRRFRDAGSAHRP